MIQGDGGILDKNHRTSSAAFIKTHSAALPVLSDIKTSLEESAGRARNGNTHSRRSHAKDFRRALTKFQSLGVYTLTPGRTVDQETSNSFDKGWKELPAKLKDWHARQGKRQRARDLNKAVQLPSSSSPPTASSTSSLRSPLSPPAQETFDLSDETIFGTLSTAPELFQLEGDEEESGRGSSSGTGEDWSDGDEMEL